MRPNEHVRFKQISLAEAFTAIHRTDAMVEALTALARGTLTLEQAQQQLDNFKVRAPPEGVGGDSLSDEQCTSGQCAAHLCMGSMGHMHHCPLVCSLSYQVPPSQLSFQCLVCCLP